MFIWVYLLLCMPLYLQNIRHYFAALTGIILLAMSAFIGGLSPFAARVIDRIGFKLPMVAASLFGFLSLGLLLFLNHYSSLPLRLVALAIFGIAIGLLLPSTLHAVMSSVPKEHQGAATGAFYTAAAFGAAAGIAVGGSMLGWLSQRFFKSWLLQAHLHLSQLQLQPLLRAADGVLNTAHLQGKFPAAQLQQLSSAVHASFMDGFISVFVLMLGLNGLVLIASLYLQGKQ